MTPHVRRQSDIEHLIVQLQVEVGLGVEGVPGFGIEHDHVAEGGDGLFAIRLTTLEARIGENARQHPARPTKRVFTLGGRCAAVTIAGRYLRGGEQATRFTVANFDHIEFGLDLGLAAGKSRNEGHAGSKQKWQEQGSSHECGLSQRKVVRSSGPARGWAKWAIRHGGIVQSDSRTVGQSDSRPIGSGRILASAQPPAWSDTWGETEAVLA